LEQALSAMLAMVAASRAEPGCLAYAYALDVIDPHLVRVLERWDSREALEAHTRTAHFTAWRSTWRTIGVSDRDLRLYEADPEPF
ncbi:MAG: putative quinol monooxygenase, partial [Hyphomonadaceae bacterium]